MAPADSTDTPTTLRRAPDGSHLVVVWFDSSETIFAASTLRQACRCSQCTARQARGEFMTIASDISVVGLNLIGSYAVNVVFSDGHSRGIFPWVTLRALSDPPGATIP